MMLKTSSNKLNPAFRLFSFTLRKNVGLLILVCIVALLFCPGYLLTYMTSHIEIFTENNPDYMLDFNNISVGVVGVTTVITSVIAVLINIINFSYMYSKKSSDVFHSIPLTRCELMFSRFFAGLTFTLIPMIMIYLSAGLLMLMPHVEGDISILLIGFAYNIMIMLLCSAVSMLFIVCAGTVFDMIMSFAVFGGGGLIIAAIILVMCDSMLTGYSSDSMREVLEVFSPFAFCGYGIMDFMRSAPDFKARYLWFFVKALVVCVSFLTASALLYRRRKAEKAGDSYAYRFIYVISGVIVAYIGAYGVGLIFSEGEMESLLFFVFALAGAMIAAVTFGAISFRGFKTVKKSLIIGGSAFACLIITYVIISTGGLGYSKRVPKLGGIESVSVYLQNDYYTELSPEDVVKLHKKIAENEKTIEECCEGATYEVSEEAEEYTYFTNITIDYMLKNGKTMSRYFYIPVELFEDELLDIYTSEEMAKEIKNILPERVQNIDIRYTFADNTAEETYTYRGVALSQSEAQRLVAAYAEDITSATIDSITRENCDGYALSWNDADTDDNWYANSYGSLGITVEPHFTNTQAVLDEIDIPARIEAMEQEQKLYQ